LWGKAVTKAQAMMPTDKAFNLTVTRRPLLIAALGIGCAIGGPALSAAPDQRGTLITDARTALSRLEAADPRARALAPKARAVLVFPSVVKAGFVFGGETGNGVLFTQGRPEEFYNLSGGSWGLQIGAQDFSYALFFMTEKSLGYLHDSAGFAAGSLPSLVVINKGAAANVDTTTLTQDIYAFPFNQRGLMANLTLEGTKITQIHPK
jgi:lipid-binding SYLF domain-containing protein